MVVKQTTNAVRVEAQQEERRKKTVKFTDRPRAVMVNGLGVVLVKKVASASSWGFQDGSSTSARPSEVGVDCGIWAAPGH